MRFNFEMRHLLNRACLVLTLVLGVLLPFTLRASSHREAPLIANDPLADNTDLYMFRSPDDTNTVTIIANYIPDEYPAGGPNYYTFGENIRYEIHIDNDANIAGDEIIYRFMFTRVNQDPTTFFNIRLGQENLKTTYTMEKSTNGGTTFTTIISNGVVPPPNIGPRSIENGTVGLGAGTYNSLITAAIQITGAGEKVFCGPSDDPFFIDSGGLFDLADAPRQNNGNTVRDGLSHFNTHSIVIQVPIDLLQKNGLTVGSAVNILDGDFVIGVWASASRQATRTLNSSGAGSVDSGNWIQVSRVGMPLTNTLFIPIGMKDFWNSLSPYQELNETTLDAYFYNPELALYMDDSLFGDSVPAWAGLRIPRNSLHSFDFGNTHDGLQSLAGTAAVTGTALDNAVFGTFLLPGPGKPRAMDIWALFHFGIPNMSPYHLLIGKNGDPLAIGKPFVNNFLPNGGDMLRLNMAVPVTPRTSPDFSSMGLNSAIFLGLTDPRFDSRISAAAQFEMIPNMDGFPNGRRLEDDATRIELQLVAGLLLGGIGIVYDDQLFNPSNLMLNVIQYSTGVESNDTTFRSTFPYLQAPWRGTSI